MKVVIDIEGNALEDPTEIWLIVCKDIETGERTIFRNLTKDKLENDRFRDYCNRVSYFIGHNLLGYDGPVMERLLGLQTPAIREHGVDTLIVSRLVAYSRDGGHSVEQYGSEFGYPKLPNSSISFFSRWSQELEDYCVRDVDITELIYRHYLPIIEDSAWKKAIRLEHSFQLVVNSIHDNGFAFNVDKARTLLNKVTGELHELDTKILGAFPPREVLIREFTPKATKFGTISRTSVPRPLWENIATYEIGRTYRYTRSVEFNPASHKQVIEVLHEAGWQPTDRTKAHIEWERELQRAGSSRGSFNSEVEGLSADDVAKRTDHLRKYGWKINENNLGTLPEAAPLGARLLARRILLESRRRTLTEWVALCREDGRIHGRFYGIGAWTHRMAHQQPNTANIPNEFELSGKKKLLGKEMRQLWCAPKRRLLVGVDAEGIQLRIFAHYIDDKEFTNALVNGRKDDKTDPHSLNQKILGNICKSRAAAKRFIFAYLLGAGVGKLAEILESDKSGAQEALDRLIERYAGLAKLKKTTIPADARRGYFIGLDGRRCRIPADEESSRRHLVMSGYLQNGEAVCMKAATLKWWQRLEDFDAKLVNFVHDEWQVECPNNVDIALQIAKMMADSLREVGEELKLKCPLAGSYWNDDHKDYTVGTNWYQTH